MTGEGLRTKERRGTANVGAYGQRVAVVGPFPPVKSGIARHTAALSRALSAKPGTNVRTWAFRRQYPAFIYPGGAERDPEAKPADNESLVGDNPLTWRATARDIVAWKPDLVVMPAWTFAVAPALGWLARQLKRKGVEICIVVHNAFDHEAAGWKDALTRWQLASATRIVTHNQALANAVNTRLPRLPIRVFPHPVFDDFPAARDKLPRRAAIELLFFGLVRPYKGLDVLLDAMGHANRDDVFLTVAGEFWGDIEPTRAAIESNAARDRIELIAEFVSDQHAADLFNRADAIVMPYRAVSGSGVMSMAFHYQRPVIASNLPGFADVLRHGETGWLFETGNVQDLAARLSAIDPEQLRAAGAAAGRYGQTLSWDNLADAVLDAPVAAVSHDGD